METRKSSKKAIVMMAGNYKEELGKTTNVTLINYL